MGIPWENVGKSWENTTRYTTNGGFSGQLRYESLIFHCYVVDYQRAPSLTCNGWDWLGLKFKDGQWNMNIYIYI